LVHPSLVSQNRLGRFGEPSNGGLKILVRPLKDELMYQLVKNYKKIKKNVFNILFQKINLNEQI